MLSCQKVTYLKACNIKKKRIDIAEKNVADSGREYLRQVRYSTFVSLNKGIESPEYRKAVHECKKALMRYLKALEFFYNSIHFDIKEIME